MSPGAVAFIMDAPGGSADEYEQIIAAMDLGGEMPAGAIYHAAGPSERGWRVIDVWYDDDAYRTFAEQKLGPAMRSAVPAAQTDIERIEIAHFVAGADPGARPEFLHLVRLPGLDAETFDALTERTLAGGPPAGLVFNANGPYASGWCVISVWTSRAERDAFVAERLTAALADTALSGDPVFEDLELYATAGRAPA